MCMCVCVARVQSVRNSCCIYDDDADEANAGLPISAIEHPCCSVLGWTELSSLLQDSRRSTLSIQRFFFYVGGLPDPRRLPAPPLPDSDSTPHRIGVGSWSPAGPRTPCSRSVIRILGGRSYVHARQNNPCAERELVREQDDRFAEQI